MIQRIQTVYWLLVVILSSLTVFMTSVTFMPSDIDLQTSYELKQMNLVGVKDIYSDITTWVSFLLSAMIPVIALITIFLYKKRMMQISFTVANIILMVGYYVLLAITVWSISDALNADWHLHFPVIFPLISIVLSYLALRGVMKDEALVRSLDRLR